jgi:hypothetical protein
VILSNLSLTNEVDAILAIPYGTDNTNGVAINADFFNVISTNIYNSTNAGINVLVSNDINIKVVIANVFQNCSAVASSADGSHLAAVVNGGFIFVSTNFGTTWFETTAPMANWTSLAMSADGNELVAGGNGGFIYTSGDAGMTWVAATVPPANWSAVALSADGSVQVAAIRGDSIYTGQGIISQALQAPVPLVYISTANGGVAVKWPLGLDNYVLQQRSDFNADWVNVPAGSIVTNGMSLMAAPLTTGNCFFRLKHQ